MQRNARKVYFGLYPVYESVYHLMCSASLLRNFALMQHHASALAQVDFTSAAKQAHQRHNSEQGRHQLYTYDGP